MKFILQTRGYGKTYYERERRKRKMKDKIKEILEQLEWYRKIGKKDVYYPECVLTNKKAFILLDYITNLQQENLALAREKEKEKQFIKDCGFQNQQQLALMYLDYKLKVEKAVELLKNKKEKNKNMTDYHQYYVEGYDKAIELTHSSHSGIMLETIKSTTIKNCDELLNILQKGDNENE